MPRLFLAIELPEKIKTQLKRLRTDIPGARWVPVEQLHLTLAFLGDVEVERMNRLVEDLAGISSPPFELRLGGFGCFPNQRRPRVLWMGVNPEPLLMSLADRVRDAVLSCEIPQEERPFSPHITLARIKETTPGACDAFLARAPDQELAVVSVQEVILFESQLTPHGALHIPRRVFKLCGVDNPAIRG